MRFVIALLTKINSTISRDGAKLHIIYSFSPVHSIEEHTLSKSKAHKLLYFTE